jgi:hypothetical protein
MTDDVEPHVNVWHMGLCPVCGLGEWHVVTVPKLATGEQYPQFGACELCGHNLDLSDLPPFLVAQE